MPIIRSLSTAAASGLPQERGGSSAVGRGRSEPTTTNSTATTSNRNEYREYFLGGNGGRCIRLKTLPPSSGPKIWEPQPPGTLRACPGL